MASPPQAIIRRFPEKRSAIEIRLRQSRDFLAMCEDYEDAIRALAAWESSTAAEAPRRARDYRAILTELEAEILANLG